MFNKMSWKQDVFAKIEALREDIEKSKHVLGEHVDKLEDGEKARSKERNILLQRAIKRVYDSLNNVDKKMVARIKTDAYDKTRQLDKVQRELKNLSNNVKEANDSQEGGLKGLLNRLQADNFNIDIDCVTSMCNVSVGCNVLEMEDELLRAAFNGIYLKNHFFDLKTFKVNVADSQTREHHLCGEEFALFVISSEVGFPEGVLKNLTVDAVAGNSQDKVIPILNSTVAEMKKSGLVDDEELHTLVLKIKRPSRLPEANIWLTVSFFKTVLRGCPALDIVRSGVSAADLADMTATAKEQLNGTIYWDLDNDVHDLDDEDRHSLDLTTRNSAMGATPIISNGSHPPLPSAMATATVTSKSVVSGVSSKSGLPAPASTGVPPSRQSSMPSTAVQSKLPSTPPSFSKYPSVTVTKVINNNNSQSIPLFKASAGNVKKVPNISEVDGTMPFSPKPGQGLVSTMRPTAMAGKLTGALSKVHRTVEVVECNNEVDVGLGASKNLPNVEDMQRSLSSDECSREDDSLYLEGPEVQEVPVHNRSISFAHKTTIAQDSTTPPAGGRTQQRFRIEEGNTKVTDGQAGSAKRLIKRRDEPVNDTESDFEDPHLYLNASKAPSPTLAEQTLPYDPAWDVGNSVVHEWAPSPLEKDKSLASKTEMGEMSVWSIAEEESQKPRDIKGFNLALGIIDQISVNVPGDLGEGRFCMQSPVHIEYIPSFCKFLISEPEYNRIGVYSKGNLRFQGWFGGSNENYTYPTSILYLDNGFLIVLERSKINIYDKEAKLVQKLDGKYNGLAKDPHGNFISSTQKEDGTTFITVIGQMNGHGIYGVKDSFPLDIARKQESKVRFLAVHGGNIYASDYALNSIYVVDMETRSLTTWDLNFSSPCASPCGLLLDDRGHVLVADSGNNRLILLNGEGALFREISLKEKNALCPSDFVKVRGKSSDGVEEDHIVVTYTGGDGTDGRLVRLKCT